MKSLGYAVSEELHNRARTATCILTIFLMTMGLVYFLRIHEGEIFPPKNTIGVQVMSNALIPEKLGQRAERMDLSPTMTPFKRKAQENNSSTKQSKQKKEREEMGKLLLLYSLFR